MDIHSQGYSQPTQEFNAIPKFLSVSVCIFHYEYRPTEPSGLSEISGGTFALYSLLCRHAKINIIPNQHRTDQDLTTYSRRTYEEKSLAAKIQRWLEGHQFRKNLILILVLFGTCMAVGDGILTPAISGQTTMFIIALVSDSEKNVLLGEPEAVALTETVNQQRHNILSVAH